MTTTADPFAGTVYRDLTTAEDAVSNARFYGAENGIAYDPERAIADIDQAIAALTAARAKLAP